jgi:hypothetical protein
MRRTLAVVAVFAITGLSGAVGPAPAAGAAQVSGPCTATLAGRSVANHSTPGSAIHLDYRSAVRVTGTSSAGAVTSVLYKLKLAGQSFTVGEGFTTTSNTWSGTVNVKDYAWATVGLYELIGEAETTGGPCTARVYVCIEGRSPFTTAAGAGGSVAGLLGLFLLARTISRRASLTGRQGVAPMALGGLFSALGGVVLMQQACVRPLTAATAAIIPIGAVLTGTVGLVFGRGTPVPVTPRGEQPRTEAPLIYQFRAPGGACQACRQHALHKVYATAEAMKRAHPGCRCPIDWRPVDQASWQAYFRSGPAYDGRRAV